MFLLSRDKDKLKSIELCRQKTMGIMKNKRLVHVIWGLGLTGLILTLILTGLLYGVESIFPVFVTFHLIAAVYLALFLLLFLILSRIFWMLLLSFSGDRYKIERERFRSVFMLGFFLLYFGGWIVNHVFFKYRVNLVSIIGNSGILLFVVSLGMVLLKSSKNKLLLFFSVVLITISLFLSSLTTNAQKVVPSLEKIRSLPYTKWVPVNKSQTREGVVVYNKQKALTGLNIYCSRNFPEAYLMDMSGNILHTWSMRNNNLERYTWYHVELCKNRDLLVISEYKFLIRLDWNSNVRWIKELSFHHDIDVSEDDNVFSLIQRLEVISHSGIPGIIFDDYLAVLSPRGEIKKKTSLFKILINEIPPKRFKSINWWLFNPQDFLARIGYILEPQKVIFGDVNDILHNNTVEIIDKDFDHIFKKGNILICPRNLDSVGIIDTKEEKLVWIWGNGFLEKPHHPTLLENGHLLIFDNGTKRAYSRVIELDPVAEKIIWEYVADPPKSFFSSWGGSNQRLPNGNTLITDTSKGRVFEVTTEGEIVWDFYNPIIEGKRREPIYRMMRITNIEDYAFLEKLYK